MWQWCCKGKRCCKAKKGCLQWPWDPRGESITTVCGVDYQLLLAVMLQKLFNGQLLVAINPLPPMDNDISDYRSVFLKLIWPAAPFSVKKFSQCPPLPSGKSIVTFITHRCNETLNYWKFSNYLLKSTVVRCTVQTEKYNNKLLFSNNITNSSIIFITVG